MTKQSWIHGPDKDKHPSCHIYYRVFLLARHLSTSFSLSICFHQGHPSPVPNTCVSFLGDLLSRPYLVDPEVDSLFNSLSWDTWTTVRDSISKCGQKNRRYLRQLSHGQSSLQEGEEWSCGGRAEVRDEHSRGLVRWTLLGPWPSWACHIAHDLSNKSIHLL